MINRPVLCAVLTASLALGVSACSSPVATERSIDGALYPAGYADGCATAREARKAFSTEVIQDENLFENDDSYRTGWRQGYAACRSDGTPTDRDNTGLGMEDF